MDDNFSAFVFKDPGQHEQGPTGTGSPSCAWSPAADADKEVYHVQGGKIRLSRPQQLMAAEAGDHRGRPMPETSSACLIPASSPSATPCALPPKKF